MNHPDISQSSLEALERFAHGPDTVARATALTALLTERTIAKVVKLQSFEDGVTALIMCLESSVRPLERLAACAQLARLEQSARAISKEIRKRVTPLLDAPLDSVSLLKEGDDRYYVAKACAWTSADWVLSYSIRSAAEEPPGAEKVRGEFMSRTFERATSLDQIFVAMKDALLESKPETETPADSMAKRMTRILVSLRAAIVNSLLPPGSEAGNALGDLVRWPFSSLGQPSNETAAIGLAREVILTTHDLVRSRFSLLTDTGTYSAIKFAKRLFGGASWPSELQHDLELVAGSILEALLLLAKQGMTSPGLIEHLELVTGYRQRMEAMLRLLADAHPELSEDVRAWLRGTTTRVSGTAQNVLAQSEDLRTDPSIGDVMIECRKLREANDVIMETAIPAIQLYDPSQAEFLQALGIRVAAMADAVDYLARRRRIGLHGKVGQEIEYAAKYFDVVKGVAGQRGKVVRPAIVRLSESGVPGEVITKGLLE